MPYNSSFPSSQRQVTSTGGQGVRPVSESMPDEKEVLKVRAGGAQASLLSSVHPPGSPTSAPLPSFTRSPRQKVAWLAGDAAAVSTLGGLHVLDFAAPPVQQARAVAAASAVGRYHDLKFTAGGILFAAGDQKRLDLYRFG